MNCNQSCKIKFFRDTEIKITMLMIFHIFFVHKNSCKISGNYQTFKLIFNNTYTNQIILEDYSYINTTIIFGVRRLFTSYCS